MAIPNEERKLPDITLVDYGIMKLKDTRLYNKAIRKWQSTVDKDWNKFKLQFIKEYGRMLQEGSATTMEAEEYGTAYLGTTEEDVSTIATITKGLTNYAERQTVTDETINNLTDHTAFLAQKIAAQEQQLHAKIATQGNIPPPQFNYQLNQQIQSAFFAPAAPTFHPPPNQIPQPMDTTGWNTNNTNQQTSNSFQQNQPDQFQQQGQQYRGGRGRG